MQGSKATNQRRTTLQLSVEDDAAIKWILDNKLAFSANDAIRLALHGYVEMKRAA